MRFGTFHLIGAPEMQPGEQRINETVAQIVLADQLGMHRAWVAEHHFSNYGYATNPLLIIAKAAGLTSTIRFGQAVIVTPFWHPLRLAEDITMTDILTGGRLDVGVGRGYQNMEFEGLGIRLEDSRAMFLEQLEIMKLAWTADDFTYQGQFFAVPKPITVLPRPLQQPYPRIWVACQSDHTVDWTASQGYLPLFSGSSGGQQIFNWRQRFVERWRAAGHAPAEPPATAVQRFVYVCDSEEEGRAAMWQNRWQRRLAHHLRNDSARITAGRNEPYPPAEEPSDDELWDRMVYGPPERCIAQIRRDVAAGFTDFIGWFDVGGLPAATVQRSMQRFAAEVMPAFAEAGARNGVQVHV
jgi:alkanesulfonate monooxygenase SsuD/methylene tetrahydromethanopterin reductase-like flavin-dependent oxidoreductase (luciferase family)